MPPSRAGVIEGSNTMLRRLWVAGVMLAAAIAMIVPARAQSSKDGTLVLLGAQAVDLSKGSFLIDLSRARGSYTALRVRAKSGSIQLKDIEVRYDGGKVHNEKRLITLNEGERTRPINPGEERFVDNLTLIFDADAKTSSRPVIEVWGLQTQAGAVARRAGPVAAPVPTTPTPPPAKGDVSAASAGSGKLVDDGEVLFGVQNVGFNVDHDVIRVGSQIGKFDKVRLRVLDNDIFIDKLVAVYAEGDSQTLAERATINRNTRSQWFDLKGDRFIKEFQVTYHSKGGSRGEARVEVLGQYAEGWLKSGGEGAKYNEGWVLLGARTAGFLGFDNDVLPVGRNDGGFTKLRVNVRDRAITLNELRVVYGSGEEDVIPVRQKVEAGGVYGPIDLKGGTRIIQVIKAKIRSRFIDKGATTRGNAIVEIWGKRG